MASYRDLLDAIARVSTATGNPQAWKDGLTGADVAVACSPTSPPRAIDAVLAALTAAHPAVFAPATAPAPVPGQVPAAVSGSAPATVPGPPPTAAQGATADAIRSAESLLARQRSEAASLDLQVLTAVVNAHATASDGLAQLSRLQREIETVVASRTDLATPAGARELQRFLIGKMRDIRDVVEHAGLDAGSRAVLADALGALYASSTPEVAERPALGGVEKRSGTEVLERPGIRTPVDRVRPEPTPSDAGSAPLPDDLLSDLLASDPLPLPAAEAAAPAAPLAPPYAAMPAAAPPYAAMPAAAPFGGAMPPAAPFGGGMPALPAGGLPNLAGSSWPDFSPAGLTTAELNRQNRSDATDALTPSSDSADTAARRDTSKEAGADVADDAPSADVAGEAPFADVHNEPTLVLLPDGHSVMVPSPELASVITDAVAGAPIPTAFSWQGITIPPPGSPVTAPVDPGRLVPGDVAVLADRHALALGNGKVLLDKQIQPISSVTGPGFVGWQHPPEPDPIITPPVVPAPDRSAATAPS